MKTKLIVLFTGLLALSSTYVAAQKGSWYIGGSMGFNAKTDKNTGDIKQTDNSWNVAPEAGTFLKNNLQLGFALNLGGETIEQGTDKSSTFEFSPVVYLRRFYKISDKFSTYTGVVGTITTGSTKVNGTSGDLSGWGLNLTLGAAYALSSRWTAVGQYGLFGYTERTSKVGGNKSTVSNFGLNVNSTGPVFNVGLYFTFKG